MSFLSDKRYFPTYKKTQYYLRKEHDSFMARCKKTFSQILSERASAFTSKASITVEAAISVTFFFFAVLCVACLFEIMALQINIKSALHSVGKEIAMEAYFNPVLSTSKLEKEIVEAIGSDRLDRSMIAGGSNGINCSGSQTYVGSTIMDLSAYYEIEIPFMMFRIPVIAREEIVRIKGWTGEEESYVSGSSNEVVYVTDYGIVYHKNVSCTYLDLSIRSVSLDQISELRNKSGGKYDACKSCDASTAQQKNVYITDYGDKYHNSLECSKLKRNIYAVPLSDVYGLGGCSKCVK